jgi:hypothetical protein
VRFYIPTIGDTIKLEADWRFTVYQEERNASMLELLGFKDDVDYHIEGLKWRDYPEPPEREGFFPAGTLLQVERIYIRKDQSDFDSITFMIPNTHVMIDYKTYEWAQKLMKCPRGEWHENDYSKPPLKVTVKPKKRPLRFWVKLDDANNIEFSKVQS